MNYQPDVQSVTAKIGDQEITLSTGELAKQAGGAILVQLGETIVLGTATMTGPMSEDADWLPLLVDYEEKYYAAGKIKGSRFIKREGRPPESAILNARLIDRSIRPLFPDGMINNVQIVLTTLSYDGVNSPDILALTAACGALMISDIPFNGPLAGVRIGRAGDTFTANPTVEQLAEGDLDLVVAGTADRITMIEAGGHEIPEGTMLDAFEVAQEALASLTTALNDLQAKAGKEKREPVMMKVPDEALVAKVKELAKETLFNGLKEGTTKEELGQAERDAFTFVQESLSEEDFESLGEQHVRNAIHALHADYFREGVLDGNERADSRQLDEIRALYTRAGVLPRTHGSGLFQRGETQVLTTATLGGPSDVQIIDTMEVDTKKRYIHYYNFPAFSVGEARPNRGPGRRDIGHGALAERALEPVLPAKEDWPYTMLLISEVLESHGSSSMASVCGSTLALMDAGVPISKPVAGIAMGLVTKEDDSGAITDHKVLTDIAGIEDEKGDMDFKVAGTKDGITAIQMDIKVTGLTREILEDALAAAKQARLTILDTMAQTLAEPRPELSKYAPRIEVVQIDPEKIGDLIGPKGKHINEIIEQTGAEIDIEDDGLVSITSNDPEGMAAALKWVKDMTREILPGERFENGKVTRLMDFGAFVELTPGVEGMVHISQFRDERVDKVSDVVKVGDTIPVVVTEIDQMGRINLSHKAALPGGSTNPTDTGRREKVRSNGGGKGNSFNNKPAGSFKGPRAPSI